MVHVCNLSRVLQTFPLRVNDCLLKVMDKDLENVSHDEAVDILKNSPPRVNTNYNTNLLP